MFITKLIYLLIISASLCFAEELELAAEMELQGDVELQADIEPQVDFELQPENPPEQDQKPQTSEADNLPSYLEKLSNVSTLVAENITLTNTTEEANSTHKHVSCIPGFGSPEVQLINDTDLMKLLSPDGNITSKDTPAKCVTVLFYSKYCPFSSLAAPPFNALPRAFPDIKMVAINAMMYHIFNTQNGIVGLPSILLFHNGKVVARYNESEYKLELFMTFITMNTGIFAEGKFFMISADFGGPVLSYPTKNGDSFLALSWAFILFCSAYYFTKTKWWQWIVETVQSNWRESEAQAQHEHVD